MNFYMSTISQKKIQKLKEYLEAKPEISMAFIFGSRARAREISESDIDIAIYYQPAGRELEWEEEKEYSNEAALWLDIEQILGWNTDLVVLNRAQAGLAFEILRTGTPLIIKDRKLYWRFLLLVSSAAQDFREIIRDWWAIKERSRSLSEEDKQRLMKVLDFLERELSEIDKFKTISQKEYETEADKRRNLERWVENITNASIDLAKVILASEKRPLPETYAQLLSSLREFEDFNENTAQRLGEFAKLRNILAHEYLDLRYSKIQNFLEAAKEVYQELIDFGKRRLSEKMK